MRCSRSAHSWPASRPAAAERGTGSAAASARRRTATHRADSRAGDRSRATARSAAASLASPPPIQPRAKKTKATARTRARRPHASRTSCAAHAGRSAQAAKKPATRTSDTRLEIVIVKQVARGRERHQRRKHHQPDRFSQHDQDIVGVVRCFRPRAPGDRRMARGGAAAMRKGPGGDRSPVATEHRTPLTSAGPKGC